MVFSNTDLRPCLVSCSALKDEIQQLVRNGELDVDLVFVSKFFHTDFGLLDKNLRKVLRHSLTRFPGRIILVYGDLCLGLKNEMKKLADEFGVVKVDALNCTDCLLGGKGKFLDADPDHDLLILHPGMSDFFKHARELMRKEGFDENALKVLFEDIRGIVLYDTLGNSSKLIKEVKDLDTGLDILETKYVGCENVKNVIQEAIEKNKKTQDP